MALRNKKGGFKQNLAFCFDIFKECKIKVIVMSIMLFIAIVTGVFVAFRTSSFYKVDENFGVVDVATGGLSTTFFARLFSMILISLILFGCSFLPCLFPLVLIFLGYRAYLLGLNITLILILYGFSGMIAGVIIALPCQLIALGILMFFYLFMSKTRKDFKCYGGCRTPNQRLKISLLSFALMFGICLIETILLWIFSAQIILVI